MAAVGAEGQTTISNASCEPEIEDLCNFISLLGVDIKGIGTDKLKINSSKDNVMSKVEYSIIPDRIEAATFMILAAITKGDIKLKNININHLDIVISKLKRAGVAIEIINNQSLRVSYTSDLLLLM